MRVLKGLNWFSAAAQVITHHNQFKGELLQQTKEQQSRFVCWYSKLDSGVHDWHLASTYSICLSLDRLFFPTPNLCFDLQSRNTLLPQLGNTTLNSNTISESAMTASNNGSAKNGKGGKSFAVLTDSVSVSSGQLRIPFPSPTWHQRKPRMSLMILKCEKV